MRSVLVLSVALSSGLRTAAAQESLPTPSRWTLAAGPDWSSSRSQLWGLRFRAAYDLMRPDRRLGLRLEASGLWGPTHFYSSNYQVVGGRAYGQIQTVDMMFGLSGLLTPFPRARFSPYFTIGVVGRQVWSNGWSVFSDTMGYSSGSTTPQSRTYGAIVVPMGIGIRARLGGRQFQIEYRVHNPQQGLTLGTRLPF
jgi:hypothetical protein